MSKSIKLFIIIGILLILGELLFIFYHKKLTNNDVSTKKNTNLVDENIKSLCFGSNNISKFTGIPESNKQYQLDNEQEALDIRGCLTDISEINGKVVFSIAFFDEKLKEHVYKFEVADNTSFMIWTGDTYITTKDNEEILTKTKDKTSHIKVFTIIADPQKIYIKTDPQTYHTFTEAFISSLNSKNNFPDPLYNIPIVGVGL
ncbi:hypothetical protein A2422_01140 [Candidatus Woesebacteria bacterium RIFOXYC1_FULL_31_51]|uniref:Uncharacterized protein n=1 Tax=Candidatus Woesebacteria bacterium GW2011_GWC2_31_9 TaxID=1618586 RepID=A0A0F9YGX9_9BACT|nr:MAG: hypothetical protein UR17_C0001G0678 [Candidatus Woesebacteria bacterium GW2011_GWF1_31_35]KKP22709.1 MAG: hypothetical protein UR11_C0002G0089 [Candidatus Woesebacteria bacterium GW2011_GWC1_30_29]KKP25908.1 MAG: hypothetical protein UR13_C0006G0047 [Candidatus Woesebacteria bacterium GW2011_GWD1_31_12]KKP27135.1 MAG: hypothetical protein UR16_C0006G0024 [Candidatus Woesebacteria bacterium GW2011_GWB1_31_29]KKP30854.1 MAG: hypothetical protein UR21_C0022G0002 [Candidatus Woesebacteria 